MTMVVMTILGARPQFIKAAPVIRALAGRGVHRLVHTGQHYDPNLSEKFFAELDLPTPDVNLGVGSIEPLSQLAAMLSGLDRVLADYRPDVAIVYGDTRSTLAGALAASVRGIPVAHIEAGLRSGDRQMPEEINRLITDAISSYLFCPTRTAMDNLARENRAEESHWVGDVMLDQLLWSTSSCKVERLDQWKVKPKEYVIATIHRAGNTAERKVLADLVAGLSRCNKPVLLSLHPRTNLALERFQINTEAIRLIHPVGYSDMLSLVRNAYKVATDSGGLQKEAYLLGTPCVTLRDKTEWLETVDAGFNQLVGHDPEAIADALNSAAPDVTPQPVFGDGHAAEKIVAILLR